jgi:ATP:ADP antiporter, AAA family
MPHRLINRVVQFRHGEARTAWLMFAYSFLAMTAHNILKPISKSKFIGSFGADNLPYIELGAGVLIGFVMLLYSWGIAKVERKNVIPITLSGLGGVVVLFWFAWMIDAAWVSAAFYVFNRILGILLISQFWTLANDVYDPRQARRIFGFIGGGASLGGAMGAGLTTWTVQNIGVNSLLLVSAAGIGACAAIVIYVVRRQPLLHASTPLVESERGVGLGEAIRLLVGSRHLQIISMVIAFAAVGAAFIDQQLSMAGEAAKTSEGSLTAFFAEVTFYLSLASFVIQVFLTSHIHRSLGLTVALLILPIGLGGTALLILATGAFWAPGIARVLDGSLRYSLDKTTREVLFLPLPPDLKLRAKAFVDVTMDRFAKAAGNVILLVLIKPWGLALDWVSLSYASLAMMGIWVVMALVARREYLASFRKSLDERQMRPEAVRTDIADPATIETLVEELANPDETSVLYAIEMLETLDKRHLITPLLLHHESPKVRARALVALKSARHAHAERWIPAVHKLLKDADAGVRAAAVRALATLGKEDVTTLLHRHLDDADSRVVVTAAVELADTGKPAETALAEAALSRLIADTRAAGAAGRRDAADALAHIRNPAFRSLLIPLIYDRDLDVAREAIASARAIGPSDAIFVPALVSLLGHRLLKNAARDTLESYGDAVVPVLAHILADRDEQRWVRRHIPGTLALIPTQAAMDALFAVLQDPDGFLRYKTVAAIETLRRRHPHLVFQPEAVEQLILKETARYYTYLSLRYNIVKQDAAGADSLVVRALDDKLTRTLDRLYRQLGLLYPWKDVGAARRAIEEGDARARASALEFLDTLLVGTIRKRVIPILDEMPLIDKVRHANSVLKSRERDLEDTLAQLIHDDDPVLAASAIDLVEQRQLESLADDLEYVMSRGTADRLVLDAANWALASRAARRDTGRGDVTAGPLPVVELADRLRAIAFFGFVSVDELFRVASTARQIRHDRGRDLAQMGAVAHEVYFLLEGSVRLTDGVATREIAAPAALAFEDMLDDRPLRQTITAVSPVICLTLGVSDFLTMLSDNIAMAQGLFRMLLARHGSVDSDWLATETESPVLPTLIPKLPLDPVEKAIVLRQNPLLGKATVDQLLDIAAITREVALTTGSVLCTERDAPAVYHVLAGELQLDNGSAPPIVLGPGRTVFVAETLAGVSPRRRATVTRAGTALRLDHDELFDVLSDHLDLLQGVFSGVLSADPAHRPSHPKE